MRRANYRRQTCRPAATVVDGARARPKQTAVACERTPRGAWHASLRHRDDDRREQALTTKSTRRKDGGRCAADLSMDFGDNAVGSADAQEMHMSTTRALPAAQIATTRPPARPYSSAAIRPGHTRRLPDSVRLSSAPHKRPTQTAGGSVGRAPSPSPTLINRRRQIEHRKKAATEMGLLSGQRRTTTAAAPTIEHRPE
uniref:Uncharacterized protein n=1 Tax=Plectus sambesii TaxID=2011161 RepID=A0A914WTD2_9BILA